jgi:RimJ/RimL family protein N-acetyltransferase
LDSLVLNVNNPNIAEFMTDGFPHPYSNEKGISFIEMATKDNPIHIFAIDVDWKSLGGIGIHLQQDIMKKNAELGYWLGEAHWSKGIVSGAIKRKLDFAFTT